MRPPSRWRYDSTFYLELDDGMAPIAATSTLPKVVFHNGSPFKAEFVVYHKPLKITECMANGVASAVVAYDGNPGYSVQACGTKFKFIANRSTSPLPHGTSDLYFKVSLDAGTPTVSPTTSLRFTNHTGASVEYAVATTSGSGGTKKSIGTRCLVPGGFDVLHVPAGTLVVATNLLPSCGSQDRLALAPHEITAISGTSRT